MVTEVNKYVHFHGAPTKGKILMVASSPAVSQQTGWPIGFWAAELTHPLWVFQEAGYEVELVSTEGGALFMDTYSNPTDASGYSAHDVISLGYLQQPSFNQLLATTKKLTEAKSLPITMPSFWWAVRGRCIPFAAIKTSKPYLPLFMNRANRARRSAIPRRYCWKPKHQPGTDCERQNLDGLCQCRRGICGPSRRHENSTLSH